MILLKPNSDLKIDKLPISGFLPRGNEGVGSSWPFKSGFNNAIDSLIIFFLSTKKKKKKKKAASTMILQGFFPLRYQSEYVNNGFNSSYNIGHNKCKVLLQGDFNLMWTRFQHGQESMMLF
jgi:hypothetical protein